jgi:hypothetical protein
MKKFNLLALLFIIMGVASANAQVSIGGSSTDNPHEGAILDLKSANQGVLLPRVRLVDFEILTVGGITVKGSDETAKGMTVYNTNAYALDGLGIYIWDGSRWNGINAAGKVILAPCEPDDYLSDASKTVDIPIRAGYNAANKLTFLAYNLGANPHIAGQSATADKIAKAQMGYGSADKTDITVFGGLYQWGRKDAKHALRCDQTSHPDRFTNEALYSSEDYDPATDILFVWGDNIDPTGHEDWVFDHVARDNRWGNGGGLAEQINGSYNSGQPKLTINSNNPCPTGFRVPTQHEWALIGREGGSSNSTDSDYFGTSASGTTPNPKVTWVPVKNAHASQGWESGSSDSWANYPDLNGYAIYSASAWSSAAADYKDGTSSLADPEAPDPLMFLPAAGARRASQGYVGQVGQVGGYWSSVVVDDFSSALFFRHDLVGANASLGRYNGLSVRCVSE